MEKFFFDQINPTLIFAFSDIYIQKNSFVDPDFMHNFFQASLPAAVASSSTNDGAVGEAPPDHDATSNFLEALKSLSRYSNSFQFSVTVI